MRKELELIECIENYLSNKMSTQEKNAFESEIKNDPSLQQKVEMQQSIMKGLKKAGLKNSTKNAHKAWKMRSLIVKTIMFAAIATGLTLATLYFMKDDGGVETYNDTNTSLISFPENDSLSGGANQYLEQEIFTINTSQDTVIESKDGIVVFIPADAFDTNNDEVDFLLQGAINPEDIIEAGLTTETSDGELLETGGMFYVDAYADGKRVDLKKELTIDVPANEKKEGMLLYEGIKDDNGDIKWTNPKPTAPSLNAVEITSLDFYPPGYEGGMNSWGYSEKDFVDSLYYSLAWEDNLYDCMGDPFAGEILFKANCASCHSPDKAMTGPALQGARERWIDWANEDDFYAYIKNSVSYREKSNTDYPHWLHNTWQASMPPQAVTNAQIDDIMCYVESVSSSGGYNNNAVLEDTIGNVVYTSDDLLGDLPHSGCPECGGINPASIKTIWNSAFNKSNLATKEFEERMPWIHQSKDDFVLNLYVNNLHLSLSEVDSLVLPYVSGEVKSQFEKYALRNEGRVEMDEISSSKMSAYYDKKRKAHAEALVETEQAYWKEQTKKDKKINEQTNESQNREMKNKSEIFIKEYEKNLQKVYCELEINCDFTTPIPAATYRVTVGNLGWNNIDRQVLTATANRESTSFNKNGKTSTITYEEWSCTVQNQKQYNRINVYNIPLEFNSYVKLNGTNGEYNYKLNADLSYHTIIMAWDENNVYYMNKSTRPGKDKFKLKKAKGDDYKKDIRKLMGAASNMNNEANYIEVMQKDQKRIDKNVALKKLRQKAFDLIFPCGDRAMEASVDDVILIGPDVL